jgi:acyl-lipid omega-6 desaturase (Delta-12 desaturase)
LYRRGRMSARSFSLPSTPNEVAPLNAVRSSCQVLLDLLWLGLAIWGIIDLPLYGKLLLLIPLQVLLARLFILGHDACHGSLFRSPTANQIVGRILFFPTLTTFSLWHVGHNLAHHGFANLKGRDRVWVPLSPEEFAALPAWRQRLERLYRSVWGLGLYYAVEMWSKSLFFPSKYHTGARRRVFWLDAWLTALAGTGYVAFLLWRADATGQSRWLLVMLAGVVPFALWNYLMGLVTFLHHSGPTMRWFDKRSSWSRRREHGEMTRNIRLPLGSERLLHNIMLHRAHHHDPRIPNYRLAAATLSLPQVVAHESGSDAVGWSELLRITRSCALYDYNASQWMRLPSRTPARSRQR